MDIVRDTRSLHRRVAVGLLACCGAALAQGVPYKVTGPDGRVTYTDRPPADAKSVRPLGAAAPVNGEDSWLDGLPVTLRQTATRYPVTLYAASGCAPCDLGRLALQQRGVPFREWRVADGAGAELQRREGTTSLPVLRVGQQQVLGFEAGEWRRTLDAAGYPAGYPAGSALPPAWQAPAPQPLERPEATEVASPAARPAPPAVPQPAPTSGGGFRF